LPRNKKGAAIATLSVLNEIEPLIFYSRRSKRNKRNLISSTSTHILGSITYSIV